MATLTIQKERIKNEGGVVVLPLKKYHELCAMAVPTYYLKGKAAKNLDKLVQEGLKEYKRGETIYAHSLKEALKLYGSKDNKN
jgi:hypothetical protein